MFGKQIGSGIVGVALAGLMLGGCQSGGSKSGVSGTSTTQAVTCDKCKTTWVTTPQQRGKVTTYAPTKVMTCPDCKSAVTNFFTTGKLQHTCKTCGGNMEPCEAH